MTGNKQIDVKTILGDVLLALEAGNDFKELTFFLDRLLLQPLGINARLWKMRKRE